MTIVPAILIIYWIYFFWRSRVFIKKYPRGRKTRMKRIVIPMAKKRVKWKALSFSCITLGIFFTGVLLYSIFYYPVVYTVKSSTYKSTDALLEIKYDEKTMFYVARDIINGEPSYYYFVKEDDKVKIKVASIEKSIIDRIDQEEAPQIESDIVEQNVKVDYINKYLKYIVKDLYLYNINIFKLDKDETPKDETDIEQWIIKIPYTEIPEIKIDTLHFDYEKVG